MIEYVIGDATKPVIESGIRIIAHICNDVGGWGSGFVVAISKKWPQPEAKYREWSKQNTFALGNIQAVQVKDNIGKLYVVNMLAQHGYAHIKNPIAVSYKYLATCLLKLQKWIDNLNMVHMEVYKEHLPLISDTTIHMPRIGCGLGGGDWTIVSQLIESLLKYQVYVYDLPGNE